MKILVFFVFLPSLLLSTFLTSKYKTTATYEPPEFTDLIVRGPFIVKIVQNQTKPLQISVKQGEDIKDVLVSKRRNTIEIQPNGANVNLSDVQVLVGSQSLKNIKASSGAQIVSNQQPLRLSSLTLSDNTTANLTSLTGSFLILEAFSSSYITISNLSASNVYIDATSKSILDANQGSIENLNAKAQTNATIRLGVVIVKDAYLTAIGGGRVSASVMGKVNASKEPGSSITVFGEATVWGDEVLGGKRGGK